MIKKYYIDGNNLIGKIPELKKLQKQDPQKSREKLAYKLERYFKDKGYTVTLFLDGYPGLGISVNKIKIVYSYDRKADDCIRDEIERDNVRKNIAVVSSDHYVMNFAKANACTVIKCEDFAKTMNDSFTNDEESVIQKDISVEEIKRLFDVD